MTPYGARPLTRAIQKYLDDPPAEMIPAGRVEEGDQVKIAAGPRGLVCNGEAAAIAEAA